MDNQKSTEIDLSYLTLDAVAGAGFRATLKTDDIAQKVKDTLGLGGYNIPARIAIAKSLAIPELPPRLSGDLGRSIKGETLFGVGPDLASWLSLLIEHSGSVPASMRELQIVVGSHWVRGMKILQEEIRAADNDASEFWRRLAVAALPKGPSRRDDGRRGDVVVHGPLRLRLGEIGTDSGTGEQVYWDMNAPGGSPHAAFMGGVGSGKTRTAAFMLRMLSDVADVPFIAFDFKGDMSDKNNALDVAFGATVLSPPGDVIPLDVFALPDRGKNTVVSVAQRLRDSFSNLKQTRFGDLQKRRLNDALELALRTKRPCTLESVRDCLSSVYAEQGAKEDGATSALVDLCRLPIFDPVLSPEEFFDRSWIISLPASVPELVRVSVVSLLTDALERYINSLPDAPTDEAGNRVLRSICVIDEAHRILGSKLPGLANLIRLGRSKGSAVLLISQRPDDFDGEDDDFLAEMGLIACFSTNARDSAVKKILGAGSSLSSLKKGEALFKMRGDAKARKITSWQ